jgi:hypothetical protein
MSQPKESALSEPAHVHAIRALAVETRQPVERVGNVYAVELERLSSGARIKDYLPVLISRRVRQILREPR